MPAIHPVPVLLQAQLYNPLRASFRLVSVQLRQRARSTQAHFYHCGLRNTARRIAIPNPHSTRMAPSQAQRTLKTETDPKKDKAPPIPRPSSSVLVISPSNQVLLLHRVQTSSSFPSAHVFPGGNVDHQHDGEIPAPNAPKSHEDGPAYRLAAIRETFEESGILLAKDAKTGRLIEMEEVEREKGRKAVHKGDVKFTEWLEERGGVPDTDALIPFTRWITPTNVPKRFTTQMYLYFLPLPSPSNGTSTSPSSTVAAASDHETIIPVPTSDGGIEHTTARFLPASTWLAQARANTIILFPPQFFLLHLVAPFLSPSSSTSPQDPQILQQQRDQLMGFLNDEKEVPAWAEKVISPTFLQKQGSVSVLGLDKPGPELVGTGRAGVKDRVVLVAFRKEGPRDVEVGWRSEVLDRGREGKL